MFVWLHFVLCCSSRGHIYFSLCYHPPLSKEADGVDRIQVASYILQYTSSITFICLYHRFKSLHMSLFIFKYRIYLLIYRSHAIIKKRSKNDLYQKRIYKNMGKWTGVRKCSAIYSEVLHLLYLF